MAPHAEMRVFVPGTPITQGSMKVIRGRMLHSNKKLIPWRNTIRDYFPIKPQVGPISLRLTFEFIKPRTGKLHSPRPDLDKLIRAVMDALTGHVYEDDSQVSRVVAEKVYSNREGVTISILDRHTG